jgi:hypothetical protein
MQIALDPPELVGKLVLASASYRNEGLHPGLMDNLGGVQPEHAVEMFRPLGAG